MSYPADYGFIEGTLGEDGDPLDALVLVGEPTVPGLPDPRAAHRRLPHGRREGPDEKIICVPLGDPLWSEVGDLDDIPQAFRDEIEHFFDVYKQLEKKKTETHGYGDRAEALELVHSARARAGGA